MTESFRPGCFATLIGSLPLDDHREAADLVWAHTPEIPLWVQLPIHKAEGMLEQFLPGLPGLSIKNEAWFIDTENENFDDELLKFYEDYMSVIEGKKQLDDSRFVLTPDTANGFFVFMGFLFRNSCVKTDSPIKERIIIETDANTSNLTKAELT